MRFIDYPYSPLPLPKYTPEEWAELEKLRAEIKEIVRKRQVTISSAEHIADELCPLHQINHS